MLLCCTSDLCILQGGCLISSVSKITYRAIKAPGDPLLDIKKSDTTCDANLKFAQMNATLPQTDRIEYRCTRDGSSSFELSPIVVLKTVSKYLKY